MRPFVGDRRLQHVPGENACVLGKDEQALADAAQDLGGITAGRSVRPIDSWNSVSPLKRRCASAAYRHTLPGVWPGVWITLAARRDDRFDREQRCGGASELQLRSEGMAENPSGPAKPLDVKRLHYLVRLTKRYDLTALDVTTGRCSSGFGGGRPTPNRPPFGVTCDRLRPPRSRLQCLARNLSGAAGGWHLGGPQDSRHREPHGWYLLFFERIRLPPFVSVGSVVQPNTIVCIIEAMKVFTDIPAGVAGTIAEILVKNGQAVEYGQPLFRVIPA